MCTLWCLVKRGIWKTADRCDKGEYDSSFSLSSFASIPPAHSLSAPSLCLFQHPSSSVFFFLLCIFFPPSTCSAFLPSDGCPWHLCSVSQMSHNRNWNINLAVDMAEKWWGGGKVRLSCCPQRCCEHYHVLDFPVPGEVMTANQLWKRANRTLWLIIIVLFIGQAIALFLSNMTFKCTSY